MADHDWPLGLPDFSQSAYSAEGEDGVIRSNFPGGMKARPRFTKAPPETVSAAIYCSSAQLQTLLEFWEITLRAALAFNMRDHSKPDLSTVEYRFLARPKYQTHGSRNLWRVELQLEKLSTFQGTFMTNLEGLTT